MWQTPVDPSTRPAGQPPLTLHESWLAATAAATREPADGRNSTVRALPPPGSARRLSLQLRAAVRAATDPSTTGSPT